jgi:hypothetical protein
MTEEARKKIYDDGWAGYFAGKTIEECPDYPTQEERDEWCCATSYASRKSCWPVRLMPSKRSRKAMRVGHR